MNITVPAPGPVGAIIALVVLVIAVALIVVNTFTWPLGLIAALAVARLT